MKAKVFAIAGLLATFVPGAVFQQIAIADDAASNLVQTPAASDSNSLQPRIKFLRPMTNEVFSDTPFYIQVTVDNFKLVSPGQGDQTQAAGYIRYTLDDFPVVCTKATQIMVNKNLGHGYVPTGKHYLRAELVDCADHSLNPPAIVDAQFVSIHPAYVEETRAGAGASPTAQDELRHVQRELDEVQQHLLKLERGDTGYEPQPIVPRTSTRTNVNSKVTQ